jgi:hypothetical protein
MAHTDSLLRLLNSVSCWGFNCRGHEAPGTAKDDPATDQAKETYLACLEKYGAAQWVSDEPIAALADTSAREIAQAKENPHLWPLFLRNPAHYLFGVALAPRISTDFRV